MDNLRSVIELLFAEREIDELLEALKSKEITSTSEIVSKETFKKLYIRRYHRYSGDQLNSLFDITNDTWSQNCIYPTDGKNVFNILTHLTKQMLVSIGGSPYCRYSEYLRWHEATKSIGEDILVTNFLAAADKNDGIVRKNFAWSPYVLSDNKELQFLMNSGLAELHYHLYGSALIFTINWLSFMNYVTEIKKDSIDKITSFDAGYFKLIVAALIRAILFKGLLDLDKKRTVKGLGDTMSSWLTNSNDKNYIIEEGLKTVNNLVESLQSTSESKDFSNIDYAIPKDALELKNSQLDSRICLMGERLFLYKCFSYINEGANAEFSTLFYIYLIIKTQFRVSLLQVDDVFGFDNFKEHNFIKNNLKINEEYNNLLTKTGINIEVQGTPVKCIEYRIQPKADKGKLENYIKQIEENYHLPNDIIHGYIVHFSKTKEEIQRDPIDEGGKYRNKKLRTTILNQAYAINEVFKGDNKLLLGIDAAGSEFNARPEVFGTVFRWLRHSHRAEDTINNFKLGITYHVGEDFYDIVDGLRAIDEAIIFLDLTNGDRIGHGTALGIDVHHYYEEKYHTVIMPKQVLLDNMAWLVDKVKQYGIKDDSGFMYSVEQKYYELCSEIFGSAIGIQQYIGAWLLRGDSPDLYEKEREKEPIRNNISEWRYQINEDNKVTVARHNEELRKLYYQYHYKYEVKENGSKSTEWKIDACHRASFVRILETIQEKMQEEIARRHIAIECNPTSNLRIGNIPRYVEHPIVKFNNEDLIRTDGKVDKSAQISVSINTDDAGIFATSLEKEFTLMALALEKETTKDGEPKYQQRSVYRWLENIRENAFIQKFGEENQDK